MGSTTGINRDKLSENPRFTRTEHIHLLVADDDYIDDEMEIDWNEEQKQDHTWSRDFEEGEFNVSNTDQKIIDLYFIRKMKPLMISKMTKQSRIRIYSIVESVKRSIIKAAESEDTNKSNKHGFM